MIRLVALAALFSVAPTPAQLPKSVLWRDPGSVAALDFGGTVGFPVTLPKPPFTFRREDLSGTQPKVFVTDTTGAAWNVKFGYEVRCESFCWRVVKACGYFAEPNFLVPAGQLQGLVAMRRTDP